MGGDKEEELGRAGRGRSREVSRFAVFQLDSSGPGQAGFRHQGQDGSGFSITYDDDEEQRSQKPCC